MPDRALEKLLAATEKAAFPSTFRFRETEVSSIGLTKREWFAGQVLAAIAGDYVGQPAMTGIATDHAARMADALIERLGRDA